MQYATYRFIQQYAGLKKTKAGTVIPNSDQNLPNGRYSKK